MKKQYTIFLFIYITSTIFLFAQDIPRIEPRSQFVDLSLHVGDLTEEQLISGALLASGSEGDVKDEAMLTNYINDLAGKVRSISSDYEKGEKILQLLHDSLFSNYIENQTRINIVMSTGTYNCVSSAVLYMAAGRASGLDINGVRTPDHAFVSLLIDDRIVDVETTNEWGYDPGEKKEFTDSFSGNTGYNYVPPGNYRLRKDINDKQMIGLVLQNRIAELQQVNNHRSSVPLAVDRYALTGSEDARKDMYDTFSNYASQLNSTGQYIKGITFLKNAITRWSASTNVIKAIEALVHNYLLSLIESGETLSAEDYLNELSNEGILSFEAIQSDKRMIYDKRTVDLLNSDSSFDDVQTYLNGIFEEGFLVEKQWINYTIYNYIKEAEILARSSGWLEAFLLVRDAPVDIRNQRKYIQLLDSCKDNYAVTIHNQFADLYNKGKYAEAEIVINEGLIHVPGNRTLTSDLQMIKSKSF